MKDEELRRQIENHLENAEELIRKGHRHRAFMEFEKAAENIETTGTKAQLEQLWAHAATGFMAAEAPIEAGQSYLQLAKLEADAGRHTNARESFLAAANAFIASREKNQELWTIIIQTVEQAIEYTLLLEDSSMAIDLLVKCASIHYRETGFTLDAINCLERAQKLLDEVPNHPLANEINEKLQDLLDQ